MENRITVSICDEEYTFVAEEAPSYMQKVGSYVNDKMSELLDAAKVGRTDAAVLTAVNITDELFKEREAGDALRRQLKQYLDEASQAKNEKDCTCMAQTKLTSILASQSRLLGIKPTTNNSAISISKISWRQWNFSIRW